MPRNRKLPKELVGRTAPPKEFTSRTRSATAASPVPFTDPGFVTKAQYDYICDLMAKRDLLKSEGFFDKVNAMDLIEYEAYLADLRARLRFITKAKASNIIQALKAIPLKTQSVENSSSELKVPEGRYALRYPADELNPIRFYTVRKGRDLSSRGGRNWEGYVFVDRHASDERFPVRGKERYRVLEEIAADVPAAASLYSAETNNCSNCGRELTRRLSRQMGMGAVCASKCAWMGSEYVERVREDIIKQGQDPNEVLA